MGAQNIVSASINNKVKNVIALSTDKAPPINLYGATKLVADKVALSNHLTGKLKTRFSVVGMEMYLVLGEVF